jgi:glycosyltransferase involved in cell wall biosynthesis
MPKISVIIPCFNQGPYLDEAVESVLAQTFQDFEILVVDDGSTDMETVKMLQDYARPKTRVIHTDNQGLSAARNNGIREAQGAYILPLDADDKIGPGYLEDAVRILDRHPDIGIVYCEAAYFGVKGGRWDLPEYSPDKILIHNVIFCTALFRKADWEAVGGYNINMVYGWEDWDFWLSLIRLNLKVYKIPKIYFFYRLKEVSMVTSMNEEQHFFMRLHAFWNHRDLYRHIADLQIHVRVAELYLDTGLGFRPGQTKQQVVFMDTKEIEFDLSNYSGIKKLRFDPINSPACIHLKSMHLLTGDGSWHEIVQYESNALICRGNNLIFQTHDPQIVMDISDMVMPIKLRIRLNYDSVGHEVLIDEMKKQCLDLESDLAKRNEELLQIYGTLSWRITRPLRMMKALLRSGSTDC